MDKKTLNELSFYKIREDIASFCVSEEGKTSLLTREPLTDCASIERLKAEASEWNTLLAHAHNQLLLSWPAVQSLLLLAKAEGATLSVEQLYAVALFCRALSAVHAFIAASKAVYRVPTLLSRTNALPIETAQEAERAIDRILDKDGTLRDLPELRAIKAKIAQIQRDIAHEIRRYTSDSSLLANVLEANVPAWRAERQVLAVKASQKSRIPGIVHEVSQSGQTVYIEPEEVVRKNNELIQEEAHLLSQTRKICQETTALLTPLTDDLCAAVTVMCELDATLAAARWGEANHCVYALPCAEFSTESSERAKRTKPRTAHASASTESLDSASSGTFHHFFEPPLLLQARHPLLGETAVPIDIRFIEKKRVLIITGPNTGGKTVTLKTFALLSLLNQAGFPVPADEGTRLPYFDSVFCDIGDEQSIDQSLSTFSAHMKNIATALHSATAQSLVLLDELGSGTDPQEGGAIAMAVLDSLIERGAFVLVTTHHGVLKNYGYTNEHCINASVDFDSTTLSPTYRLRMGIPGESHALDIAARSGLERAVVNSAKRYLVNEQADVSTLINGLIEKHAEADRLLEAQKTREREQTEKQHALESRMLQLRQTEHEIKEREQRAESQFIAETRRTLENLVRTLREGEITREKTRQVKQFIAELEAEEHEREEALRQEEEALEKEQEALKEREKDARRGVRTENGMLLTTESGKRTSGKSKKKKKASAKEAFARAKTTYDEEQLARLSPKQQEKPVAAPVWQAGADVFAGPSRTRGTLLREERRGVWTVQLGAIRMSIRQRDMVLAPQTSANGASSALKASVSVELNHESDGENAIFMKTGSEARPVFELRLLGMRAEEAIRVLQRQLDLCSLQNFKTFSIVHGKGNGVLQQAVQDYLASYPGVADYHFARPEEGGTGKTYVRMR